MRLIVHRCRRFFIPASFTILLPSLRVNYCLINALYSGRGTSVVPIRIDVFLNGIVAVLKRESNAR